MSMTFIKKTIAAVVVLTFAMNVPAAQGGFFRLLRQERARKRIIKRMEARYPKAKGSWDGPKTGRATRRTMKHGGYDREYFVYVPKSLDRSKPAQS